MHLKQYAFNNLPFSDLFQAYVSDFSQLTDFYSTNPFDNDSLIDFASAMKFSGDRETSVKLLKEFNEPFAIDPAAIANIERLKHEQALAIVTGQQLGLYGGPVYTMLKILTTIHLAQKWEKQLDRPVIPVFWLADEDHDYDEIRRIKVLNDEGVASFELPSKEDGLPVSELHFPDEIKEMQKGLLSTLIDTDFSDDLWALLDKWFAPGYSFSEGFGNFIARLFSKHGLVLAGSNDPDIKQHFKKPLATAVENADDIRKTLESQSNKLGDKFHRQATIYDSHLFYLHPKNGRLKIHRDEEKWQTEAGQQWNKAELIKEIEANPEQFSPDVFLRPILQDTLLPTFGYVAGPGEVAYYGQMKSFYRCFNQSMPVIFPRLSATFIEPAINRILSELSFDINEYNSRIEDLESEFVARNSPVNIERIFEDLKEETIAVSESYFKEIMAIDDTLEGAAEKARTTYFNQLDKLEGKTYRAIKKHKEIQLNRIRRIQQNIFPNRNLQERELCGIYYMNKFGLDIWDRLLKEMKNMDSLDKHQLIYI